MTREQERLENEGCRTRWEKEKVLAGLTLQSKSEVRRETSFSDRRPKRLKC